ncbi:MAG: Spore coat domain protein [Hyphomicrobiales bacterium]|nr:Spore coat domain protein [Hyphomicrobiales bacterium]
MKRFEPADLLRHPPFSNPSWLTAIACAAALISCGGAQAQTCSASVGNGTYGAVAVLSGSAKTGTTSMTVSCAGKNNRTVRVCVELPPGTVSAGGQRIMAGSGASLTHEIFSDAGGAQVWGSWGLTGAAYGSGGVQVDLKLAPGSGTASQVLTVYDAISASQTTALPGNYVWTGTAPGLSYTYLDTRSCPLTGAQQISASAWTWSASVAPNCLIQVSDVNFGTTTGLSVGANGAGRIDLWCTRTTAYIVSLDGGMAQAASPLSRLMSKGPTGITYGLYSDAALTQGWGWTDGRDTLSGTGTGTVQSLTVYGRISAQQTPETGLYSDRVVVSLTY